MLMSPTGCQASPHHCTALLAAPLAVCTLKMGWDKRAGRLQENFLVKYIFSLLIKQEEMILLQKPSMFIPKTYLYTTHILYDQLAQETNVDITVLINMIVSSYSPIASGYIRFLGRDQRHWPHECAIKSIRVFYTV